MIPAPTTPVLADHSGLDRIDGTPTLRMNVRPTRALMHTPRLTTAFGIAALSLATILLGVGSRADDLARLQDQLQRTLDTSTTSSVKWGAVVTRGDGMVLFSTNAHQAFIPASNTKLFIGALALDNLGPGSRLGTSIRVNQAPDDDGVLRSDLWVLGQGDPTWNTAPRPGSRDDALMPLVAQWQSKGLRRVAGDLVLCDAALRVPDYGPGWDEEDRAEAYGAPVSAFVVNDNTFRLVAGPAGPEATRVPFQIDPPLPCLTVDWRVLPGTNASHRIQYGRRGPGSPLRIEGRWASGTNGWSADLAVADPAQAFGELLKRTLERRGIPVSGSVKVLHSNEHSPALEWDRWTSEPLSRRLALCLKPSQNLHAQLLLAEVGRLAETESARTGAPAPSRRHDEWGLSRLPGFLDRAGVTGGSVHLEEGSGLSRANRVSPAATVTLLRFMAVHPDRQAWKDSLPVGGTDGTLRQRFKTGRAKGNVRAKTGSLRGVHALGGYVTSAGGHELVFAIYANEAQADPQARARMDRFVEVLAGAGDEVAPRPLAPRPPR